MPSGCMHPAELGCCMLSVCLPLVSLSLCTRIIISVSLWRLCLQRHLSNRLTPTPRCVSALSLGLGRRRQQTRASLEQQRPTRNLDSMLNYIYIYHISITYIQTNYKPAVYIYTLYIIYSIYTYIHIRGCLSVSVAASRLSCVSVSFGPREAQPTAAARVSAVYRNLKLLLFGDCAFALQSCRCSSCSSKKMQQQQQVA